MTDVDVVLPVLDEVQALEMLLTRFPPGFRPLVVDNGSTDGSGALARRLGARVLHEGRRGFGAACWAGLTAATTDVVCFMDADGSLDPAELALVAGPVVRAEADLCVGRRVPTPGAWPLHARLANQMLACRVRTRTGLGLSDLGPMRAARRRDLVDLGLADRRFGWPLEMVLRAHQAGWVIVEAPTTYRPRRGRSKVTGTALGTVRAVRDMEALLR